MDAVTIPSLLGQANAVIKEHRSALESVQSAMACQLDFPESIGEHRKILQGLALELRATSVNYNFNHRVGSNAEKIGQGELDWSVDSMMPAVTIASSLQPSSVKAKEERCENHNNVLIVVPKDITTLTLQDLTGCTVIILSELRSLFLKNIINCNIFAAAIDNSVLAYGLEGCTLAAVRASQVRLHDTVRSMVALPSDKAPIFEKCSEVRLLPSILSSISDSSSDTLLSFRWSDEWRSALSAPPVKPVNFSTQYLEGRDATAYSSIVWDLAEDEKWRCLEVMVDDCKYTSSTFIGDQPEYMRDIDLTQYKFKPQASRQVDETHRDHTLTGDIDEDLEEF